MQERTYDIEQILKNLKIEALNEMQEAALAAYDQDNDIILLSNTGSGKTLAFLLPLLQTLDPKQRETQAIIIVPSRELAQQIERVFKAMQTGLKVTCCYGGHKREIEENNLLEPPALLIGTPGRLADHIRRENITTHSITTLVLDEFDKSLELGFQEEVSFIIQSLPAIEKRVLTSATEAAELPEFINLNDPQRLEFISDDDVGYEKLAVRTVHSEEKDKANALFRLICALGNRPMIVFCNHRESVERVSEILSGQGIVNEFYHGAMEQVQRDSALCKFRNGSVNVLVTTDLAARGLDIPNIRYIIHYHLPLTEDSYTHRNGRTARMDASGTAILLIGPEEKVPVYVGEDIEEMQLQERTEIPEKPKWVTLFIAAGKKDKVNKVDIVGFLGNKGKLKMEDIGLIEVKDFFSFVAIRKASASHTLTLIKNEKIKNKKVKIEIAK
ncbi:MAG: DEAD/DEAH box helicase [Sphingobacteriales bacterium]|nr:MAG: DEAD/DEAH box helicase [Sphingobacteriales bacterium]